MREHGLDWMTTDEGFAESLSVFGDADGRLGALAVARRPCDFSPRSV
jgi:hypothetical protein